MDKTNRWNEHLRATTTDTYMILEVDNQKVYYSNTVEKEDENRERSDSTSSSDSDSSNQEIEKQGDQETSMVKANHFIRWYSCQSNGVVRSGRC